MKAFRSILGALAVLWAATCAPAAELELDRVVTPLFGEARAKVVVEPNAKLALAPNQQQVVLFSGPPSWLLPFFLNNKAPDLFADVPTGHYWYNGRVYNTQSEWLTAAGFVFTRASQATFTNPSKNLALAAVNELRTTYDPVTGAPLGWQREGIATNLLNRSNEFSNAYWLANNTSVAQNVTGPDGTTSGWTVTATGGGNVSHAVQTNAGMSGLTASTVAQSIYASAGTSHCLLVNWQVGNTAWVSAVFDLNGVPGPTGLAATQTAVGSGSGTLRSNSAKAFQGPNGYLRAEAIVTVTGASIFPVFAIAPNAVGCTGYTFSNGGVLPFVAAGTETIHIANAQVEKPPTSQPHLAASSYMPATNATATRQPEFLVAPWPNITSGTFVAKGSVIAPFAEQYFIEMEDGTFVTRITLGMDNAAAANAETDLFAANGNTPIGPNNLQVQIQTGTWVANTPSQEAMSFQANNFTIVKDGGSAATTSVSGPIPTMGFLYLAGDSNAGSYLLYGIESRVIVYNNVVATIPQLQTLTIQP